MNTTKQSTVNFPAVCRWMLLLQLIAKVDAKMGKKKRIMEEDVKMVEETRVSNMIVIGDQEIEKNLFFIMLTAILTVIIIELYTTFISNGEKSKAGTVDVVLVGCGIPKKGMGWYHLTQLLKMETVNVSAVVEPFLLNKDLCPNPPNSFQKLISSLEDQDIHCTSSIRSLNRFRKNTICLIAGRTSDNPKLFNECISHGAKVIYLEKPGAESVEKLQLMSDLAERKGVKVYLGYNKNVTPYVQKALALSKKVENANIIFSHNNSYTSEDLPECFTRNSEGMLKNMVVHELALLVTFFDVTVDTIDKFEVDARETATEKLTLWQPGTSMPDPTYISDFSRVSFKVTTKKGRSVTVIGDRCGGNISSASVEDSSGIEAEKFEFPNEDDLKRVDKQCAADPEMMPYFFVQNDDYLELKNRVVNSTLNGTEADGVATIKIGIEALKLAEYGTERLNKAVD